MADKPVEELLEMADSIIEEYSKKGQEAKVYFKFTCAHCGNRCTFEEPNTMYVSGHCDRCEKITQIKEAGFLLVVSPGQKA